MADAADGGNDWELLSLTASAYAAAPGPISPPPPLLLQVDPAATSEQSPPSPPPPAATFMSQHFNLPAEEAPAGLLNGGRQGLEFTPAMPLLDQGLGIPCPEKDSCASETEALGRSQPACSSDSVIVWDGTGRKISPSATLDEAGSDRTRSASPPHNHVSAAAAADTDDGIAVGSAAACLPAPAAAPPRALCEAWWRKTFSFMCGNATESLTFHFVFLADKLQLRLELGVDGKF
ncbi:unnamed protein product [Triticum turgidum subsp. durum]|uniref:Uncharacterized protein n=1 Tax=Triticum turgidum subsp. durum TaxID=4567 RepID=A0A9R1B710_TRITD|nr:unnamed protein product [Triticum turgidum subsp. durum]